MAPLNQARMVCESVRGGRCLCKNVPLEVCTCGCVYLHMYIFVYMCICFHVFVQLYVYLHMCKIYVCGPVHVCYANITCIILCVGVYLHTHMCISLSAQYVHTVSVSVNRIHVGLSF